VAYAADDRLVEPRIAEELAQAIPTARALRFEEGGHNLQKTWAADLGAAIRGELSR
jgi:pimeloyl-ACP methyl ester carboxylesterase